MISDENILTFLYFVFFIFFLFVHLSIIFWLILKEIFLLGRDIIVVSHTTIKNYLRVTCFLFSEFCIELFTHDLHLNKQNTNSWYILGGRGGRASISPLPSRGGTSSKPASLISRDFQTNFSCSIFFFLLASCFLFLCFKASPNSSCDIELWSW